MPDTSGAERIFALPVELAATYDDTAHEVAVIAAAAAMRSIDDLDQALHAVLTPLLGSAGADEAHVCLALTIRRLAVFVRSLSEGTGASTHPLVDSLRRNSDLTGIRGSQLVAHLEAWLQTGGDTE